MKTLETIQLEFSQGKMSLKESVNELWENIWRNKKQFNFGKVEYDDFMDFLEYAYPKFEIFLKEYNSERGTFPSYIYSNLHRTYFSWFKKNLRNHAADRSYLSVQAVEYEAQQFLYQRCEYSSLNSEKQGEITLSREKQAALYKFYCGRSKRTKDNGTISRKSRFVKDMILVLALKSAYYITDSMIEKVSQTVGIEKEKLSDLCNKARENLCGKLERREVYMRKRDNAFFFHRKYMIESKDLSKNSVWCEHIAERYKKQTKIWETANKCLKEKFCLPVPSNKVISRLSSLPIRRIEYINKVLKEKYADIDNIFLKCYSSVHENIFGNRKSE
ncbi:MAG: hypothetical protein SO116_04670 [Treponema sp.]|nr:hypothetical protein [Treponema sp.]